MPVLRSRTASLATLALLVLSLCLALPGARADGIVNFDECNVFGASLVNCSAYTTIGDGTVPPLTLRYGVAATPDCGSFDFTAVYETRVLDGPECSVTLVLLVANESVPVPAWIDESATRMSSNSSVDLGRSTFDMNAHAHPLVLKDPAVRTVVDLLVPFGDAVGPAVRGNASPLIVAALGSLEWSPDLVSYVYGEDGLIRVQSNITQGGTPDCYGLSTRTGGVERDVAQCVGPLP